MNGFGKMSLIAAMVALAPVVAMAGNAARDAILQGYAEEAVAEDPAFAGFSAERGQSLYMGPHQGGNPETNACAACHTTDPTAEGRHRKTGRAIEPMAVSVNPDRFTDLEEVEKQFGRDCKNVLGRACTAQEKGDFIIFRRDQFAGRSNPPILSEPSPCCVRRDLGGSPSIL